MGLANLKNKKEDILYWIITIISLEAVRVKFNRLEDNARKENWEENELNIQRSVLLKKASMVYGLFLGLLLINIPISLTSKITNVYPGTMFLKSNIALIIVLIGTYWISVKLSRILLYQWIVKLNSMTEFWKKLGRSAWDGTKIIAQAPVKAGGVVADKVMQGTKLGIGVVGKAGEEGKKYIVKAGKFSKDKVVQGIDLGGRGIKKAGEVIGSSSKKTAEFIAKKFNKKKDENV